MTRHDDGVSLRHMLDHALEAASMIRDRSREDLDTDRQLNLSMVRLPEVVGEAASRVSQARRAQLPGIRWSGIVGLRSRLIHGYDEVDFDVLWDIAQLDLPPVIAEPRRALGLDDPAP